jgi:exosortase
VISRRAIYRNITDRHFYLARTLGAVLASLLPLLIVWMALPGQFAILLNDETYSFMPLIPLICVSILYFERDRIFSRVSTDWQIGALSVTYGVALVSAVLTKFLLISPGNQLSYALLGTAFVWIGVFAFAFGRQSLRAAASPAALLFFAVPIPEPLLTKATYALQSGTAVMTAVYLRVLHVPFSRSGFDFDLPGMTVSVTEACSGIHSTLALLILTIVAGHLFIRTSWKKAILYALVIPISILKNGLRVAALSFLAVYMNPDIFDTWIHKFGGYIFFAAAFVPLTLLLLYFYKTDQPNTHQKFASDVSSSAAASVSLN